MSAQNVSCLAWHVRALLTPVLIAPLRSHTTTLKHVLPHSSATTGACGAHPHASAPHAHLPTRAFRMSRGRERPQGRGHATYKYTPPRTNHTLLRTSGSSSTTYQPYTAAPPPPRARAPLSLTPLLPCPARAHPSTPNHASSYPSAPYTCERNWRQKSYAMPHIHHHNLHHMSPQKVPLVYVSVNTYITKFVVSMNKVLQVYSKDVGKKCLLISQVQSRQSWFLIYKVRSGTSDGPSLLLHCLRLEATTSYSSRHFLTNKSRRRAVCCREP
jgi:hypothetical protein